MRLALDPQVQAGGHGLERIELIHEALPEINFKDVDLSTSFQKIKLSSPIFISSMTAGHESGENFNHALAMISSQRQILMGVGSQRRQLDDPGARQEWHSLRQRAPKALLVGNLGLSQLIQTPIDSIKDLIESLQAVGLFIHLNSLQEALQPEGTPEFKGGLNKIEEICQALSVPVIVKEVGCGFSEFTLKRLEGTGIYGVDLSGYGGTHWGRIEGLRAPLNSVQSQAARTFSHWGTSTLQSMLNAQRAHVNYQIWASGGVRNGLEAAKLLSMGAAMIGLAYPWLMAYKKDEKNPVLELEKLAERLDYELRVALFCTGCKNIEEIQRRKVWKWRQEIHPEM